MALTNGFVTTAGTTALDARQMDAARVIHNTDNTTRTGQLFGDSGALQGNQSMSLRFLGDTSWVLSRGKSDGAVIVSNVGDVTVPLDPAPSANSRYDVVYLKHNDTERGDATSAPVVDKVTGTAAASPTIPAAPSGALVLGTVLVPAGVTSTNASGVVISNTVQQTALNGAPIRYRSVAALNADVANVIDGTLGYVKGNELFYMRGGAWVAVSNGDTGWIPLSVPSSMTTNAAYRRMNGVVYFQGNISLKSGQFLNGYTDITTLPSGFRPSVYFRAPAGMFNGYTGLFVVAIDGSVQIGASSDRTADTIYLGAISYAIG